MESLAMAFPVAVNVPVVKTTNQSFQFPISINIILSSKVAREQHFTFTATFTSGDESRVVSQES